MDKNRNKRTVERKNNDNEGSKVDSYFASYIKNTLFKSLEIRGAGLLAITIALLLTGLTYIEDDDNENRHSDDLFLIIALLGSAIGSFTLFIFAEKKTSSPLVNLKLIANKTSLPIVVIFLILGFTMFMVYQTIPILTRAPMPLGFGGSAITSSLVLLPFTIVFLILSPIVSTIVRKFGNIKPLMAGSIISATGYISILLFHSTELQVAISLAVVSSGLALLNTIGMNIIMLTTPRQFGGITIGIVQVFMFIGMSIGPIIGGMYMQTYQETTSSLSTSFPSSEAYDLIFLTASISSLSFIILAIILKKELPSRIADPTHDYVID